ncbi:MAG: J domain-containing protein [Actinomycetota bacterium]|nr:J domain-containing protein [Actinomycetota bacterium]
MDYYRTLQISRDAEPEVVERAYKALCLKYHPDVVAPEHRPAATARMQRINEAYRVLSDPKARRRYTETLSPVAEGASAWEQFMSKGLLGLWFDQAFTRSRVR